MDEQQVTQPGPAGHAEDWRSVVRTIIGEYLTVERRQTEPAHKAELEEERKRREQLERRVNELVEENKRNRQRAEESERSSQIRAELQRLGVAKVDLAYRIVKDEITRADDGSLVARTSEGERGVREYLSSFVKENPEFLPARMAGGSGASSPPRSGTPGHAAELERIRPGMSPEELQQVREHISQVAAQSLRGE
ncbi:MAG: hypothetical protein HY858_02415 [Candidatus Solibacter usitatus]|nr:hypothetical protein [Candidatus Solibacter usitatus]